MGVPKRWTYKSSSKQHHVKGTFRTIMALNFLKKGILQGYHQERVCAKVLDLISRHLGEENKKIPIKYIDISHYP